MAQASDVKAGTVLRMDKNLYKIVATEYHMGGGKMGGLVHMKLKDLRSGAFLDRKFKPDEKVETVELERKTMEYLYKDGENYFLMDPESYEQVQLGQDLMGPFEPFLQPNMKLPIEFFNGDPVNVAFPEWVELEVVSTSPSLSSLQDEVYKPATLSNGMEIQVPQFVKVKDIVKVNVSTRKYMGRVK